MEMSNETPCIGIFKQTKMPLFKNRKQESKTGPVWGLAPMGVGRI
jgi:hypothetical protein